MPPRAKGSEGRSNAPVLPTITATRPSLETQREPPERVTVDPSKLGHNAAVKAKGAPKREQKATLRNELFKEIGIEAWFKENAIPYDFTPTKKSSRNNFLTASNVSQSQLEKVYRWTFFKGRAGESAPLRLVMDNIEAILLDRKSVARSGTIKIPDVWLADTNIGIGNPSPFQMLRKALLFYLEYANKEHIKYQGSHKTTPPPFDLKGNQGTSDKSTLDLSLYDSDNVHASGALSIEWTMLKLLAFPGAPNTISEMDVERHIGSILTGIFNVRGCTRYSSTTLKYPTILGCFGSYPRPHTACQISAEQLPGIKFCRPLVLAGEAKKQQNYVPQEDAPSGSANPHGKPQVRLPRPASQLAWAFQPALELFIVELITKYKNPGGKTWKEEWDPLAYAPIPSHMVVFGIVYDKDGLVIYSYSPTYKVLDGKVEWMFECRQVSTEYEDCFNGDYTVYKRAQLFRALLAVVTWSDQLTTQWVNDLSLPPIIAALDKKWESVAF